ncbi:MAG: hypothetical protein K6L73_07970 [Cellvibrionaceae bacterium]
MSARRRAEVNRSLNIKTLTDEEREGDLREICSNDRSAIECHRQDRERLEADMEAFLAQGGCIQEVPLGKISEPSESTYGG